MILAVCFLSGSKQLRKQARVMREYYQPFNYAKEHHTVIGWEYGEFQSCNKNSAR